jgi:hypothetical protein
MQLDYAVNRIAKRGESNIGTLSAPSGFDGVWNNQLGSKMSLVVRGNAVTVKYESAVSGLDKPVTGDIVGFVADDIIAIVVKWNIKSVSMTTWVGQAVLVDGRERLNTLWHLIRNTPEADEPEDAWAAVLAGADYFSR